MDYKEFRERYQYDAEKDLLGVGGFGRVVKAHDLLLDRWVALKIFSRDVPERYDLISEIRRAIDLNHPNICRYHGAEVLKGSNALGETQMIQVGVMEFVECGTIDRFLVKHPEFRKKLLADVLRGLSYLHHHHPPIIHRDLKPSNVLVGYQDGIPVAKITDFGISKSAGDSGVGLSQMGLGTLAYMAPEQLNPVRYGVNGKIQCNLDLWSYGAMMIELLTGVSPFGAGLAGASTGQIFEAIIQGIPAHELNGFEEPYRSVLRLCMVQESGKRAQNANELLSLLEAAHIDPVKRKDTIPEKNRDWRKTVPIPTPFPQPPPPVIPEPEPEPQPANSPWKVRGIVLGLGALALAIVIWAFAANGSDSASLNKEAGEALSQQDYSKAVKLYTKACDAGFAISCNNLGVLYLKGQGVATDLSSARDYFTKACGAGIAIGCNNMGAVEEHTGYVAAGAYGPVAAYERACTLGDAEGCRNLGDHYRTGTFIATDMQEAKKYYQMACDKGDQTGCNSMQALQTALDVLNKPEGKSGANQNPGADQKRREAEARKLLER